MNILTGNTFTRKATFFIKGVLRGFYHKTPIEVIRTTKQDEDNYIEGIYVINLDRQFTRWKTFIREARLQKVRNNQSLLKFCHRVPAIDGKNIPLSDVSSRVEGTYSLDAQYYVDPDPRLFPIMREKKYLH